MADYGTVNDSMEEDQLPGRSQMLMSSEGGYNEAPPKSWWSTFRTSALIVLSISAITVLLYVGTSSSSTSISDDKVIYALPDAVVVNQTAWIYNVEDTIPLTTDLIYVTATNEYGSFVAEPYNWMKDVDGTQLVEPYKVTNLAISGSKIESTKLFTYAWQIKFQGDGDDAFTGDINTDAVSSQLIFKKVGKYDLTVFLINTEGVAIHSYTTLLICK